MKRKIPFLLLTIALALVLSLTLVACGDKDNAETGKEQTETVKELTADGGVTVSGEFDKGATLEVKTETTDGENGKAALSKISDKSYDETKVAVFDISVVKDGAKVQPSGKVKVTMQKPFDSESGYVTYHIKEDSAVEELTTTLDGDKISFETESFSYFIVTAPKTIIPAKARTIVITAETLEDKENDGTPLTLTGEQFEVVQGGDTIKGTELTSDDGEISFEYKAKDASGEYSSSFPTDNGEYLIRVRIAKSADGVWLEAVSEGKTFNLIEPVRRTKLNAKGYFSPQSDGTFFNYYYNYRGDSRIIDPDKGIYTAADAEENQTSLYINYYPENFKYEETAKDYFGQITANISGMRESCVELRVGAADGVAVAKWQGIHTGADILWITYEDGRQNSWRRTRFAEFAGEADFNSEYLRFDNIKNVEGYTDEDGKWISTATELDVYVVRYMVGTNLALYEDISPSYSAKIPDEASQSLYLNLPDGMTRCWYWFSVSGTDNDGNRVYTLLINSNVKVTVFDGFGNTVFSGYNGKMEKMVFDESKISGWTYDVNNGTRYSISKTNDYYVLIETDGASNPECKIDLRYNFDK